MTDDSELGKCAATGEYLDGHYKSLPEFHRRFLEGFYKWHDVRLGLTHYSQSQAGGIDRLRLHQRVRCERLGLRLSIAELIALVFPLRCDACVQPLKEYDPQEFLNNPERIMLRDLVELMRQGYLTGDHLPASELDHKRSIKDFSEKYPKAVVNLLELEKNSYRLRGQVSRGIVEVWRQYVDLHDDELKQGALLSGGDKAPAMPSAPKPKQEINMAWQRQLNLMRTKNNKLSYNAACKALSEQLKVEGEEKCSVNTIKRRTKKW